MGLRILLVDDSATIRLMIRKAIMLSIPDVDEIIEATDGIDALAKLSDHKVDLMLVDINMPRMDGVRFISRVKTAPKYADIPVIVVSTEGSEDRIKELKAYGIKDFIRKPFKPEQLRDVISKVTGVKYEPSTNNLTGCDF